jgi:type I restriction enzyme M protein
VLFIDARRLGRLEARVHRVLDPEDIETIAGTYHAWRNVDGAYADAAGLCKSATLEEIARHDFVLTPGRYVGAADVADDDEPLAERMARLVASLRHEQTEGRRLETEIATALARLGFSP